MCQASWSPRLIDHELLNTWPRFRECVHIKIADERVPMTFDPDEAVLRRARVGLSESGRLLAERLEEGSIGRGRCRHLA
jgi:hypothetical protein